MNVGDPPVRLDTGKTYIQHYAGRLVAEHGKIKLLREALDTLAAKEAFTPAT